MTTVTNGMLYLLKHIIIMCSSYSISIITEIYKKQMFVIPEESCKIFLTEGIDSGSSAGEMRGVSTSGICFWF
jgi:hypothetical protein